MFLNDLNDDELILIFKFCSELDHRNIAKVCKLFDTIIEVHFNEKKCRNLLMVTHMKNFPAIFERTLHDTMKYSERLRIHQNWMFSSCQQLEFFQHRENYLTNLQMDQDCLYTSNLGEFNIFKRRRKDGIEVVPLFSAGAKNDSSITSLKRKGDMIAGSRSNGSIFTYSDSEGYNLEFVRDGCDALLDLDFFDDVFVTVTRSDTQFHRLGIEMGLQAFDTLETKVNVGLQTVNFNPNGEKILGTTAASFYLIDPETGAVINKSSNTSQIYSTQWVSNSSFLYTSWNNPLSLIDCRMELEQKKFSCGNFTATSIDYDGRFGVLYGTLLGMIILCDLRNPRTFERVFHLDTSTVCRRLISDESQLFVSTDNAIHLLNFN
jgi:hypothetical protein